MQTSEQDYRLGILNGLLTSTHRDVAVNNKFHQDVCGQDPLFYQRLGAWYTKTGDLRDHKFLFIANLCISQFEGHRDVGCALLRELPPHEVVRVVEIIRENKKSIPRTVISEIKEYLIDRESKNEWFDSTVITARKALKQLYVTSHHKPSERAQAILFDNNPPQDSKCYALKLIANTTDPSEQAKLINEYKIPYRIASTVIKQITPAILAVLIDSMSSQELINSMGSLQKHGAFNNPDIKSLVDKKLEKAKTAKNVAALKGTKAIESANLSEELNSKLNDVIDTQIKNRGRIKRNTAILVDKSGSMTQAIELAQQIATLVSSVMDATLYVYAFDSIAYPIQANGNKYEDWAKAFRGINAGGGTVPSSAVDMLSRNRQAVEQIIIITDEGETPGSYKTGLQRYQAAMNLRPYTYVVRCGTPCSTLTTFLQREGFEFDAYTFSGDYYSLPNLISYLTRPSRTELLLDIMQYQLPTRKERNSVAV